MFGFGWGIAGAALATSVAQYISFFILYWKLRSKQMLQARHIRTKPKKDSIQPLLKVELFTLLWQRIDILSHQFHAPSSALLPKLRLSQECELLWELNDLSPLMPQCTIYSMRLTLGKFHMYTWSPFYKLLSVQSGLALSGRSIVMMGTYVTATSLIAGLGATTLAASEILRQVFYLRLKEQCCNLMFCCKRPSLQRIEASMEQKILVAH